MNKHFRLIILILVCIAGVSLYCMETTLSLQRQLIEAAANNRVTEVQSLIAENMPLNGCNEEGETALSIAAKMVLLGHL